MPELTVIATATAKPGQGDQLEKVLRGCVAATHAEAGNLHFSLHRSTVDPDVVVAVERWASKEAHEAHFATPHIQTVVSETADLMAGPPVVDILTMVSEPTSAKGRL